MARCVNSVAPYGNDNYNNFVFTDCDSYTERCKKKTEWVTRGRVESAFCNELIFITLTYDRQHLPTTFKKCQGLQAFRQRETRKKYPYGKFDGNLEMKFTDKWITHNSRPLNLKGYKYRTTEIVDEQQFKNAKFNFQHSNEYKKYADCGLLILQHLSDFLSMLKKSLQLDYNIDKWRFIANGEYGQNTHRPHYHILLFSYAPIGADLYSLCRMLWQYGKIISVQNVKKTQTAVSKLSAYICAHTVKNDLGNTFQNEFAPPFKICSTFGGGIGYQLTDFDLMCDLFNSTNSDPFTDFCCSLHNSLSAWDRRSSVTYQIKDDENNRLYEYEFPRYYKDKVLNYLALDQRTLEVSRCRGIVKLVSNFCAFSNLHGKFDLLPIFVRIGCLGSPLDILTFFIQINYKKIAKNFGNIINYVTFAKDFLRQLRDNDDVKRKVFKERFNNRKQEKKYQDYLKRKGYEFLN